MPYSPDQRKSFAQDVEDPTEVVGSGSGRVVGPYKLTRKLGKGGTSTVYLAVRADDQYQKRVAIKLVKPGMDTEEILRRFRQERQILAALEHLHIARLLDGGSTEEGRPYFVMEYIEGEPITEYCDSRQLPIVRRLELFREVCSAVQYAHQNLVVHRDLKPSNILVTTKGVVKLLDFGIAKVLNPELSSQTLAPTTSTQRLMTPEYASPEQVHGLHITTASDVYTLGVLLYELLASQRPFDLKNSTPQEIERVICESEPERPSMMVDREAPMVGGAQRTTPERLRRQLEGDLDNIVLMAMRKEPQRRYASAQQFSEDLRRYLEKMPVLARKDTIRYRAGKFIRRNQASLVAATLVLLSLVTGVVATVWQAREAVIERCRAEVQQKKSEKVLAFLVDLFKISDPSEAKGATITAREILDRGAKRVERDLVDQPEVQATLLDTIGVVYRSLGLYKSAQPLVQEALKIRQQVLGEKHTDVAESLYNLAELHLALFEYEQAEALHRKALTIRHEVLGQQHPKVADSLAGLAMAIKGWGSKRVPEAEVLLRKALAMRRVVQGKEHPDVADNLDKLAIIQINLGNYQEAEALYREALNIRRKLLGEEHPKVALSLSRLAAVMRNQGRLNEAESLLDQAMAQSRESLNENQPFLEHILRNLAFLQMDKGNYQQAEEILYKALAVQHKMFGDGHPKTSYTFHALGRVMQAQGNLQQAEALHRKAIGIMRGEVEDDSIPMSLSLRSLAEVLTAKGDHEGAEDLFRRVLKVQRKYLSKKSHPLLAYSLLSYGSCLIDKAEPERAEPLLREAVEIMKTKLPRDDWCPAVAKSTLGACLTRLQRYNEAEPLLQTSWETLKAKLGNEHPKTRQARRRLIDLYERWKQPTKATLRNGS